MYSYPRGSYALQSDTSHIAAGISLAQPTAHSPDVSLNSLCKEYTYQSLASATGGFRPANIIGKGSFGAVYRGILEDQTDVAIKVISNPQVSGFEDEVRMLTKYRHPNLVMLLGYGRNGNQRLLVYEYMDNGDCEKRLKSAELSSSFTWQQRLSVLLDACRGIAYLTSSSPAAFHRDIKPSNILLDRNMTAKMADFGLARELPSLNTSSVHVKNTAGTIGYACHHYIKNAEVSEATEIYSFGICMLEFLSNHPPAVADPVFPSKVRFLVDSIQGNLANVINLVDRRAAWPDTIVLQIAETILQCLSSDLSNRPTFCAVVKKLRDLNERHSAAPLTLRTELQIAPFYENCGHDHLPARGALQHGGFKPVLPTLTLPAPASVRSLLQGNREKQAIERSPQWPSAILEISAFPKAVDVRYIAVEFSDNHFTVGRGNQAVLFNAILQSDQLRLCVSREHFRIHRFGTPLDPKYRLENLSGNGTYIEGQGMLDKRGDVCEIVGGDIITLIQTNSVGIQLPFIQILFTYSRT